MTQGQETPDLPIVEANPDGPYPAKPALVHVGSIGGEPMYFIHDPERVDRTRRAFEDYEY